MAETATINISIESKLKREVERIFSDLGLSETDAIKLFYHQVKLWRGLPFDLRIPNETTIKTFEDTDNGKNLVHCKDAKDMFEKLGI